MFIIHDRLALNCHVKKRYISFSLLSTTYIWVNWTLLILSARLYSTKKQLLQPLMFYHWQDSLEDIWNAQHMYSIFKWLAIRIVCDWWPWWRYQMETFSALLAICAGNSPVPGEFPTRKWRGALMLSLICAWTNRWVNKPNAGDLRHHSPHYDVIVMQNPISVSLLESSLVSEIHMLSDWVSTVPERFIIRWRGTWDGMMYHQGYGFFLIIHAGVNWYW